MLSASAEPGQSKPELTPAQYPSPSQGRGREDQSWPPGPQTCILSTTHYPGKLNIVLAFLKYSTYGWPYKLLKRGLCPRCRGESYSGSVSGVGPGQPETAAGSSSGTGGLHSPSSKAWQPALLAPGGSRRGRAAFARVSLPTHTQSQAPAVHQISQCLLGQPGTPVNA